VGEEDVMKLLVDIGNTNLHFLAIKGEEEYEYLVCDKHKLSELSSLIEEKSQVYISSVNQGNLDALLNILKSKNIDFIKYIKPVDFVERIAELNIAIPNLNFLAPDLFLDVLGMDNSTLVADFGTAAKYLFLNKNGEFKGGTLGMGLKSTNKALADSTDLLEEYNLEVPDTFISLNTKDAINIDTIFGSANKLISLYRLIKKEYNEPKLKLVITGRDAGIIEKAFERLEFEEYTLDKLHTFKGMIKALNLKLDI
jgi:pantothenate kinase type III